MNKVATFLRESSTARFLIPVGIILTVFGVIMFITNSKNSDYVKINAIISKSELVEEAYTDENGNNIEATYNVYVKYNVNGTEYEENLGELSGYKEGDKITIYYNPNNPKEITQTKSVILPIIFIVGGVASFAGGVISAVNAVKKNKKLKEQEKEWNV